MTSKILIHQKYLGKEEGSDIVANNYFFVIGVGSMNVKIPMLLRLITA
ncbi:TPA: hypothetical protein QCW96_003480 [Bacillus pacificus]|nr:MULTISPECIES: hypothetical protein [Bacillus cereus group]EDX59799.1 hypothetical protein BC03BB108_B0110 [Bacillus cereus 03BB108]MED1683138.1 hypothetical protein [Bacillus paranthracis]HDR7254128.1 hypothetical protein [Bacillus pacificus]